MVLIWVWYGVSIVFGIGIDLVLFWYGVGIVLVRCWYGFIRVLEWFWYGLDGFGISLVCFLI